MANRVVLAGGTGYLGTAPARELAGRGAAVVPAARGRSRPARPVANAGETPGTDLTQGPSPGFRRTDRTKWSATAAGFDVTGRSRPTPERPGSAGFPRGGIIAVADRTG
jgi:nucleoside-diphosphate-sugar epimerase